MSTPTSAVTLSVLLLLSHLFLSSHSLQDPTTTVAVSATESGSGSESEPSTAVDPKEEPYQTVVFHQSESDGPVDPDLIAHSFRLPSHRHQHHQRLHGLRCGGGGGGHRRPVGDGTIRLPSMQRGLGGGRGPFVEIAAEDFEQQMKRARKEKKWMRKERKDDDDSDSDDEFEHEKKRMKRPRREGTWGFMDRVLEKAQALVRIKAF
ncbi:putative basic proline-rich protein-like [Iris pallida]|uniref:Basic proline-rich protein-like n=1 Tax=Iris pallida TaxID=29817 RepID=A0AAX6G4B7_IRIPA|nr:putative basic proline-rich protein-like [Iris pallida]